MILEILNLLKVCLVVALLTGLLFGYLYTKLKARELYHPDAKKFTKKIKYHGDALRKVDARHQELNDEIKKYESKLKETNSSISKYKEQFLSQKDLHINMLDKGKEFKKKYEDKKSILDHYTREIDTIKQECRLDNISSIEENKESIKRLFNDKSSILKEKQEKFSETQERVKKLESENSKLEEKLRELDRKIEDINIQTIEKKDILKSLESDFLKEYDELTKKITLSQERVTEFRERLAKLKNY